MILQSMDTWIASTVAWNDGATLKKGIMNLRYDKSFLDIIGQHSKYFLLQHHSRRDEDNKNRCNLKPRVQLQHVQYNKKIAKWMEATWKQQEHHAHKKVMEIKFDVVLPTTHAAIYSCHFC